MNVDATGAVVPVGTPGSAIVCRSVLDQTDTTCVPYDPFGAAPSAASVNYLNVFGVIQGITSEQIGNVNFTGLLGEAGVRTPWAEDGVAINAGVEYRRESLELNPDTVVPDAATSPARALRRFRSTATSASGKSSAKRRSRSSRTRGSRSSPLNLGYRKSWYDLSNDRDGYDTDTYKISAGVRSDPRHPFPWLVQPRCSRSEHPGAVRSAVRRPGRKQRSVRRRRRHGNRLRLSCTGPGRRPVASPNPAGQYNGLLGGNPNLTAGKGHDLETSVRCIQPQLHPEARRHRRLVEHQGRRRDPGLWARMRS